ncbi:MAG: AzlD domain-containing protein [Desulfovibrio sp.]|nr:AzlD domain-containing protein [Desulfovibrio sp.]
MTEIASSQNLLMYLCLAGCVAVTVLPKILPVTFLHGDSLPPLFRRWLDFVPVAVMAALVGSEVFFYEGQFNLGVSNLFLMVSLPTVLLAWKSQNYFLTIAVGLVLVILARAVGLY